MLDTFIWLDYVYLKFFDIIDNSIEINWINSRMSVDAAFNANKILYTISKNTSSPFVSQYFISDIIAKIYCYFIAMPTEQFYQQ